LPVTKNILPWELFNTDFMASQRTYQEVAEICEDFKERLVDLRPYMIEEPFTCSLTDKLPKILDMFRYFHLRALPVVDPNTGLPVAILTRQDIFSYMPL